MDLDNIEKNLNIPVRGELFVGDNASPNTEYTRGFGVLYQFGDVRSLQKLLRNIASYYDYIPTVIPDGIFGDDTLSSVKGFQSNFGLEPTGEVDLDTWNKIVAVSNEVDALTSFAERVFVYPETLEKIYPGQKNVNLYVIQAMIKALSETFKDFDDISVTGIHDDKSVKNVRNIQKISGLNDDGVIDVEFFNFLADLYETYVSRERVTPYKNYQGQNM